MSERPAVEPIERLIIEDTEERRSNPEEFLRTFDLSNVPTAPGCYIMRDAKETVVYVGKALNLRARVRAYFNDTDSRYRVRFLMRRAAGIEFLVTNNEKEALLLENSLIKKYKPRYNVRLKDDKTYVSLRINVPHEFPRITVTRKLRKDGSRYFGPYSNANAVRDTLKELQRVFPLRTCSDNVLANRSRPCLYYQMGQCAAPCVGYIGKDAYRDIVDQAIMVLEGRSGDVEKQLEAHIQEHAERLEFEEAAMLRDRLLALRRTLERQRTVHAGREDDRDVFGVYCQGRYSEIQVLFFRAGKMVGGRSFSFNHRETPMAEVLSSLMLQFYSGNPSIPQEVLVPEPLEDADVLSEILSEERGRKVQLHHPQRGEKKALVELAGRNAQSSFEEKRMTDKANEDLVGHIQEKLQLRKPPRRIECFDISTIQGDKPVGAMSVFQDGEPDKNRYRRFSIREVEGQDDFAMMREMLMRRLKRAIAEDDVPDLLLIDGGKGQLNVAVAVLEDLGLDDQDVVSIAKSRDEGERGRSPERFFLPGRKNPVILPQNSPIVLLMARIRDEAHRFAVTYHRNRRKKGALRTPLVDIPGVGPKRARTLLNELGSLARVKAASVEDIAALPGFSKGLAKTVKQHLESDDA
jgi:excinuclease ABC subunit C